MTSHSYEFDYFVLGAGSGGVRSARIAGALGAKVGICEESALGGTCVNVGCVPKKLFVYGAGYSEHFEDAAGFGWTVGETSFDWSVLRAAKDKEIERLNHVYDRLLRGAGVELIEGRGRLVDAHTVRIGDREVTAENILVATGSRPFVPMLPGKEHVLISDDLFYLDELPRRAVVVGGGYIGVEFAGILHGLGVETTLVYRSGLPLRGFDEDVRAFLAQELAKKGIRLMPDTHVDCIYKQKEGALEVVLADQEVFETDAVFYATGRVPNTEDLGLEAAGVVTSETGAIVVDDEFRSTVPSIYAVGDVIDRMKLTPVALAEGMALARRLFSGPDTQVDYTNIPTAVFSTPNVGTVGLTEAEARARHPHVAVYKSAFRPMKHTLSGRDEKTFMKLLVDRDSDRVLGCHMVGPDAGEIVQGLGIALTCGATKAQFDATIGIHPTAAEEFVTMRTPEPEPSMSARDR